MKRIIYFLILSSILFLGSLPSIAEDNSKFFSDSSGQWIYLIQVGAFDNEPEAKELMSKIYSLNMPVQQHVIKEKWHRVLVGPYSGEKAVSNARKILTGNGLDSMLIRHRVGQEN